MSLILVNEPTIQEVQTAAELELGTWFLDAEGDIFGMMLDDRTNERRLVCVGGFCRPFITANSVRNFKVKKILSIGTILQITSSAPLQGGQHE